MDFLLKKMEFRSDKLWRQTILLTLNFVSWNVANRSQSFSHVSKPNYCTFRQIVSHA